LCWRMKNRGYTVFAEPKSVVYHLGGGTLNYNSPKKTYLNFRNSLFTLYKNAPSKNLAFKILIRLILDGVAGIKFLTEGNFNHLVGVLKAHMHFYKNLPKLKKKRKILKKTDSLKGILSGSIVAEFYLKGNKRFKDLNF
jgi:GT2 family glycosyltransferase